MHDEWYECKQIIDTGESSCALEVNMNAEALHLITPASLLDHRITPDFCRGFLCFFCYAFWSNALEATLCRILLESLHCFALSRFQRRSSQLQKQPEWSTIATLFWSCVYTISMVCTIKIYQSIELHCPALLPSLPMLFRAHFFRGVQVASGDACSCKRRRVLSGQMSNEKKPWLFTVYTGLYYPVI